MPDGRAERAGASPSGPVAEPASAPPTPEELRALAESREARTFDRLAIVVLLGFFSVIPFVSNVLYFGDWDFWADWKDKLWWPIVTPASTLLVWGAVQYVAWSVLRMPVGLTFSAFFTLALHWSSRYGNWHLLESYPLNFIFPSLLIPLGIVGDAILMFSRSFVVTGLVGGFLWGLAFYAVNWVALMPYLQPVDYQGATFNVADLMGYYFVRPQTPEYLRRIDQGTLSAFIGQRIWITVFNAGVFCPLAYWAGCGIGKVFAVWPLGRKVERL
jgi:methane/ammonia monooxygenase subunit A